MTISERLFLGGIALILPAGACITAWALAEGYPWPPDPPTDHLLESIPETTARLLGIAHFMIAFLFLGTSRRMRQRGALARLVLLGVAAMAACGLFAVVRHAIPVLAVALFTSYFLIHDFRDRIFFYRITGDLRREDDHPALGGTLVALTLALTIAAVAVVAALSAWGWFDAPDRVTLEEALPPGPRWAVVLGVAAAAAVAWNFGVRNLRRTGLSLVDLARGHRPAVSVLLGSVLYLAIGAALGGRAHWIVSLHVTGWYAFTVWQLRRLEQGQQGPRFPSWAWWRGTPAGFQVLHLGAFAVVLIGAAIWFYGFGEDPASPIAWVLSRDMFSMWTIVHITLSFTPR